MIDPDGHPDRHASSAAPLRESDIGLLAPEEDDDGPRLPTVRIFGINASSLVIAALVISGAWFALSKLINYSVDEVGRAKSEVHEAFAP